MVGKIEGKIYSLLCEGQSLSKIAKQVSLSPAAILKRARIYEKEGKIERIAKYPSEYRKAQTFYPPLKPVANFTSPPLILPRKFGGIFAQVGKPPLPYNNRGKAHYEEREYYKAQFGKNKAQLWLYSGWQGATVQERIDSGHAQLLHIAATLSHKFGITLTLLRWYEAIEWIDPNKERSKGVAGGAGMGKGERREVAGAIHKFSDFSHPDQWQFDPKPKGVPVRATDHAKIHEQVYGGEYEKRFEMLMQLHEKLSESIVAIRQRMEVGK